MKRYRYVHEVRKYVHDDFELMLLLRRRTLESLFYLKFKHMAEYLAKECHRLDSSKTEEEWLKKAYEAKF